MAPQRTEHPGDQLPFYLPDVRQIRQRSRFVEQSVSAEQLASTDLSNTPSNEFQLASKVFGAYKAGPVSKFPAAFREPISHETFRTILSIAKTPNFVRACIRLQLLQCQRPRELLRVIAAVLQSRATSMHLSKMYEPLMRALYRCRQTASDRVVLGTLHVIIARFRQACIHIDQHLYQLGLKFAARSRSLSYMKKYLKYFHDEKFIMSSNVFRSIIAKFSIGHRGLGEIRNGRWRRSELLQVLTGFDDCKHLPSDKQFHLEKFLDRTDWQFWHGWVAALARCRDHVTISREWELWKQSDARQNPRRLKHIVSHMTTRSRGDYWFLEQMCHAGAVEKAWALFRETDYDFTDLKPRVVDMLMEGVEFAGPAWNESVRQALVNKYDWELRKIEQALGVKWVQIDSEGAAHGYHVMTEDQEEVLDRLGAADWKFQEDFGYPYDQLPVGSSGDERSLHDATPTTLVRHSNK